jgi:molecular chaperone HtpG
VIIGLLQILPSKTAVAALSQAEAASAADLSFLLLEQAQILDGELPKDTAAFATPLNRLVLRGFAVGTQ